MVGGTTASLRNTDTGTINVPRCLLQKVKLNNNINNVCFQIGRSVEYLSLGCFHDRNNTPVISSLESISATYLKGPYQTRENAVKKCALEAAKVGFKAFALQDGGACLSGSFAHVNYSIYGETECPPGGKGGPNVSEVYLRGGEFVFCCFTIFYYSKASPYHYFRIRGVCTRAASI